MKCPSEMIQNIQFFRNMKSFVISFFVFHFKLLFIFPIMNTMVYVNQDIH